MFDVEVNELESVIQNACSALEAKNSTPIQPIVQEKMYNLPGLPKIIYATLLMEEQI